MVNALKRVVKIQEGNRLEGITQKTITLPKDFGDILGLNKGDEIELTLVLGSGKIILETIKG